MPDQISILVVEDEAMLLLELVDRLEAEGYRVYEATNADIAIELLETHPDIRLLLIACPRPVVGSSSEPMGP
jgi:CheY-like chemotaxis protein